MRTIYNQGDLGTTWGTPQPAAVAAAVIWRETAVPCEVIRVMWHPPVLGGDDTPTEHYGIAFVDGPQMAMRGALMPVPLGLDSYTFQLDRRRFLAANRQELEARGLMPCA